MPAIPLKEFDQEMASTRRLLERVPSDRGEWKPHPKSFSLGHLAQLVARMPGWNTQVLRNTELDLGSSQGYSYEKTETLLREFDDHVREARAAIAGASDADFVVSWSLRHGSSVFMTLPRVAVVRQNINHLVHHRAQLGVYLRLTGATVPSTYGPSADETLGF